MCLIVPTDTQAELIIHDVRNAIVLQRLDGGVIVEFTRTQAPTPSHDFRIVLYHNVTKI